VVAREQPVRAREMTRLEIAIKNTLEDIRFIDQIILAISNIDRYVRALP
jgi:hypothetical protein